MSSVNFAPRLSENDYARLYDVRRNASTMTSASVEWLCSQSQELLKSALTVSLKCTFNVLSVGAGSGDIDVPFLLTLQDKIIGDSNTKLNSIRYVALEPNRTYREVLLHRIEQSELNLVTYEIHHERFEDFDDEMATYDLVLFGHVMYYFENCALALQRARYLACPTGSVIIFHLSCTGVPDIINKLVASSKDEKLYTLLANDIKHVLERLVVPFQYLELPAELDLSECIQLTEKGRDIMSFCLERDLKALDKSELVRVSKLFKEEGTETTNGTILLKEPVGVFSVSPGHTRVKDKKDNESVRDYRELCSEIAWESVLRSVQVHQSVGIRVLDVACGRGRWLKSFSIYNSPRVMDVRIRLDVLDVCQTAVAQISNVVQTPFKCGQSFVSRIQDATLERNAYNIIWSMHGLYAVSLSKLTEVLINMKNALQRNGICVVALGTRDSFYGRVHKEYVKALEDKKEFEFNEQLTCAEDVIEAVQKLGMAHKTRSLVYEEKIDQKDEEKLSAYVAQQALCNCFNLDGGNEKERVKAANMLSGRVSDKYIMRTTEVQNYMRTFLRKGHFCFQQEVLVISFGEPSVVDALHSDLGIYS